MATKKISDMTPEEADLQRQRNREYYRDNLKDRRRATDTPAKRARRNLKGRKAYALKGPKKKLVDLSNEDRELRREKTAAYTERRRANDSASPEAYVEYLLRNKRSWCSGNDVVFDISLEDLDIPELCHVLKTELRFSISKGALHPDGASLDRLDPSSGYTRENTRLISNRANQMKSNLDLESLNLITEYLERELL